MDRPGQDPEVEQLRAPLEFMLREQLRDMSGLARTQQLLDLQRNHLYWKGDHYVAPRLEGGRVRLSGGAVASQFGVSDTTDVQDYTLNYVYGEGLKLVGILGRTPNVTAVADSDSPEAVSRARKADRIIKALWPHLKMETANIDLVLSHWLNGTTYAHSTYSVNPEEYGYTEVPVYENVPQEVQPAHFQCWRCGSASAEQQVMQTGGLCPTCAQMGSRTPLAAEDYYPARTEMVPQQTGTQRFPNGSVEVKLYSGLQVTTPFNCGSLEEAPWLLLEYEADKSILLSAYPELAAIVARVEAGDTTLVNPQRLQGKYARAVANAYRNYSYDYFKQREWTYSRVWVRTSMYYAAFEQDGYTEISGKVAGLKEKYPSGMKLTFVNGHLIRVEDEKLTDVWTACKATAGETMQTPALCNPYIQANDIINDTYNIAVQTAQKGLPLNLFDPQVINPQFFRRNRAAVADWIPARAGASGSMREAVYQTQNAQLDPAVVAVATSARQSAQEIVGITNVLTGLDSREKTLGEAEMNRNQALMPHNTEWAYIRQFWAGVVTQCIVHLARYTAGRLFFRTYTALPVAAIEIDDIDDLLSGGWHVECDQGIPMTYGQRRAQIFQMLEGGELMVKFFGLGRPKNVQAINEILGNEDFDIPGMAEYEKVMADIRDLLREQPIQGPDGQMQPSIPPDDFEMDHQIWVELSKGWFIGEEGQSAKKSNPNGYQNVLARAKAELAIVNMLMAANQPQPEGRQGPGGEPRKTLPAPGKEDLRNAPPDGAPGLAANPPQPEEMPAAGLEGV